MLGNRRYFIGQQREMRQSCNFTLEQVGAVGTGLEPRTWTDGKGRRK